MYITFVTSEYPHPKIGLAGGIGTSIFTLANLLTKKGTHVNVVVYGMDRDDFFVDNGIKFYLVKNVIVKGFSYFFTVKKVQKLIKLLKAKQECDFVEVPDWTGFSAFLNFPAVNSPSTNSCKNFGSTTRSFAICSINSSVFLLGACKDFCASIIDSHILPFSP